VFLGVDAAPGTQQRAMVPIGEALDGSPVQLPVAVLRGVADGPILYLQAGLHGDELTGIDVCRRALASLDPTQLRGTIACVPLANPPAYRSQSRGGRHEERGPIDANRIFPGSAHGLLTERIAHLLFTEFVAHADLTLDLHSALEGCNIAPFVYVDPDDDETGTLATRESAARAFGTPYVYYKGRGQKLGTSDMSRSLRSQADQHRRASFSAEMGESGRVTAAFVPLGVRGVHNVLRHLGIEDGTPEAVPEQRSFHTIRLVHSEHGGGLRWRVELEAEVQEGDPIADVVDVFGETVETVEARADGIILRQMRLGAIATGAEVAWIAS
jgi:uncharacterized protein